MRVLIAMNRYARAQRRRLTMAVAVLTLATGVGLAHSAFGAGHMAMGGMDGHPAGTAIAMCLAVAETAAAVAIGVALTAGGLRPAGLLVPMLRARSARRPRRDPPDARARSSPARLQVMRH